ncbi:MAG: chromosomal replication initiator protein DnaA [Alphaproteobacteria bacterium]
MTKQDPGAEEVRNPGSALPHLVSDGPVHDDTRRPQADIPASEISRQWTQVVTLLRKELGEATYQNWLRFMDCEGIDGGGVHLTAPSRFKRDWISTHLGEQLLRAWGAVNVQVLRLDLRARESGPGQPPSNISANGAVSVADALPAQAMRTASQIDPRDGQYGRLGAPLDPRFTFEDFVVGKSNEFAHAAARRVADSDAPPFNPLFLHGGVGLGKTHLMHAIAHAIRAQHPERTVLYLSAEKFMYQFIKALRDKDTMPFKEALRSVDVLMVDDVQFIGGKGSTQEEFFHTFNALIDHQKQLVISADRSPSDLDGIEERIRSRLGWGLVADIHPTDYELRLGILQGKAEIARRQTPDLEIDETVLEFLAHRISSNVRDVEGALIRVVAFATLVRRPITVDMAREVLQDLLRASERRITIDEIQRKAAEYFNIRLADMLSARRARTVARPRQVAMYLAKQLTARSLPEIGRKFGGRDHTTVIHAVRRIEQLRESDNALNEDVERLQRLLQG